jgi:carbonic anhydrase
MHVYEELEAGNRGYVEDGRHRSLDLRPAKQLTVLTCMDARIDVYAALGLDLGDVHVIRVAGGRVTEESLRSLTLSTHLLGTRRVAVIHHTDCGLCDADGTLVQRLEAAMGHRPLDHDWRTFADPEAAVREDCEQLLGWPDRPPGLIVAGYVLDITDGTLRGVVAPTAATDPDA